MAQFRARGRTIREAIEIARLRGVEVEVRGEASGWPVLLIRGLPVPSPFDDFDAELTEAAIDFLVRLTDVPAEDLGGRVDR